jgi:hypothetical protein
LVKICVVLCKPNSNGIASTATSPIGPIVQLKHPPQFFTRRIYEDTLASDILPVQYQYAPVCIFIGCLGSNGSVPAAAAVFVKRFRGSHGFAA